MKWIYAAISILSFLVLVYAWLFAKVVSNDVMVAALIGAAFGTGYLTNKAIKSKDDGSTTKPS